MIYIDARNKSRLDSMMVGTRLQQLSLLMAVRFVCLCPRLNLVVGNPGVSQVTLMAKSK